MNKDLVKKLKDNPYFSEFQDHVVSLINILDSVQGLGDMKNEDAGETAKVRAETILVLKSIFQPFVDFNEKRKPTKEEISEAKSKVGL